MGDFSSGLCGIGGGLCEGLVGTIGARTGEPVDGEGKFEFMASPCS